VLCAFISFINTVLSLCTVFISLFSLSYFSRPKSTSIKFTAFIKRMIKGFYVIFVVMVLFLAKDNDMLICGSVGVWERASLLPLVLDFRFQCPASYCNYGFASAISFPAGLWGYTYRCPQTTGLKLIFSRTLAATVLTSESSGFFFFFI